MGRVDDETLWQRSGAGDKDAFAQLFDRHGRAIHGYCFRRTGDHTAAEDLLSVVFLEAWRRRNEVVPEHVLPWLYGVATNVLRNRQRASRRYRAALDRLPPPGPEEDFANAAAARLDAERQMRSILVAVSALPELEREVLALCVWQGLTSREAAVALGIPETTVRTRLHRAREHLTAAAHDAQLVVCEREEMR